MDSVKLHSTQSTGQCFSPHFIGSSSKLAPDDAVESLTAGKTKALGIGLALTASFSSVDVILTRFIRPGLFRAPYVGKTADRTVCHALRS